MVPTTASFATRVPTRRISFDEEFAEVPKHFTAGGDLLSSHLVAALSAVFPDGEDFFVRSVRHYRATVTDPLLKQQVAGFIGQEAMHGREHRAFNGRLAQLGYPTRAVERFVRTGLALRTRIAPAEHNLAATAALEHFTATLAELLLTNEQLRTDLGHDAVRNLFVWHALEESEHKAVAFDVYQAIGGREWVRVLNMNLLTVGFFACTTGQMIVSLLRDRATYQPGNIRASWRRFRASPLLKKAVWRQLREYNRKGFHPDDRNTSELAEHWRAELFGEHGTLNGFLVS
jgi:predicted metal-dependent hydrolase